MSGIEISRRAVLAMAGSAAVASLLPSSQVDAAENALSSTKPVRTALTLFSRHLHWAGMEEAIEVAANAGYGGIAWTIRPGAHILPQNVARDLPRAVELTHRAGLGTPLFVTALNAAESPYAEAIIETATGLGMRFYRAQTSNYDFTGDVPAQLAAMCPRVASLVRLNERYGATALFHTHAGEVGGAVWDLWMLLRDFDPGRVGINFDTGYGIVEAGNGWREAVRFASRYIHSLSLKDFRFRQQQQAGKLQWNAEICPPGQGMVNFQEMLGYFQSTGFRGPAEVQFEYPIEISGRSAPLNLMASGGGGDVGRWKLEMPKRDFVALLKRDADFYIKQCQQVGLVPASGMPQA